MAAGAGVERFGEVDEQRSLLEAAGGVCREQPGDALLAFLGLAAEAELAVDDSAAQRSLGVVVGRLHARDGGECPERGPGLEEVAGHAAAVFVARRLAGEAFEGGLPLGSESGDFSFELAAVAGVLVDLPCPESRSQICKPSSPNSFSTARPSAWAVKSRRRCAQQICRRASGRWL